MALENRLERGSGSDEQIVMDTEGACSKLQLPRLQSFNPQVAPWTESVDHAYSATGYTTDMTDSGIGGFDVFPPFFASEGAPQILPEISALVI